MYQTAWQRETFAGGWVTPSAPGPFNDGCWSLGGYSGGTFNVAH
jgi:hypothetical protein